MLSRSRQLRSGMLQSLSDSTTRPRLQAFHYYYQAIHLCDSYRLPLFGLGQMYIQRADNDNAIRCFEQVLTSYPEDYDTIKILGSLYANSNCKDTQNHAKTLLTEATQIDSSDHETWIELAQLLEQSDPQG